MLRLLLAQGEYDPALSLSERLLRPAKTAGRTGRAIEALVLQALAWQGKKDNAQAITVLAEALALAQPEGYVRIFLDEGEPMARLLYQVKSQRSIHGYASKLLSALGETSGTDLPTAQLLIEPLTSRELEVLGLIEAGDTNQDIADRLVISLPTVKRHISNINAKLGAKNRTQAVSLARELGLLE
jgi:LuxR family maltose regulon positive regulatory protein